MKKLISYGLILFVFCFCAVLNTSSSYAATWKELYQDYRAYYDGVQKDGRKPTDEEMAIATQKRIAYQDKVREAADNFDLEALAAILEMDKEDKPGTTNTSPPDTAKEPAQTGPDKDKLEKDKKEKDALLAAKVKELTQTNNRIAELEAKGKFVEPTEKTPPSKGANDLVGDMAGVNYDASKDSYVTGNKRTIESLQRDEVALLKIKHENKLTEYQANKLLYIRQRVPMIQDVLSKYVHLKNELTKEKNSSVRAVLQSELNLLKAYKDYQSASLEYDFEKKYKPPEGKQWADKHKNKLESIRKRMDGYEAAMNFAKDRCIIHKGAVGLSNKLNDMYKLIAKRDGRDIKKISYYDALKELKKIDPKAAVSLEIIDLQLKLINAKEEVPKAEAELEIAKNTWKDAGMIRNREKILADAKAEIGELEKRIADKIKEKASISGSDKKDDKAVGRTEAEEKELDALKPERDTLRNEVLQIKKDIDNIDKQLASMSAASDSKTVDVSVPVIAKDDTPAKSADVAVSVDVVKAPPKPAPAGSSVMTDSSAERSIGMISSEMSNAVINLLGPRNGWTISDVVSEGKDKSGVERIKSFKESRQEVINGTGFQFIKDQNVGGYVGDTVLSSIESDINNANRDLTAAQADKKKAESDLVNAESDKKKAQDDFLNAKSDKDRAQAELDKAKADRDSLVKQRNDLAGTKNGLVNERNDLSARSKDLDAQISQLERDLANASMGSDKTGYREETRTREVSGVRRETRTREVERFQTETRTREVEKIRKETRTRETTKYRDETRTRQVTKTVKTGRTLYRDKPVKMVGSREVPTGRRIAVQEQYTAYDTRRVQVGTRTVTDSSRTEPRINRRAGGMNFRLDIQSNDWGGFVVPYRVDGVNEMNKGATPVTNGERQLIAILKAKQAAGASAGTSVRLVWDKNTQKLTERAPSDTTKYLGGMQHTVGFAPARVTTTTQVPVYADRQVAVPRTRTRYVDEMRTERYSYTQMVKEPYPETREVTTTETYTAKNVPYTHTETYTVDVPYTTTETYTVQSPLTTKPEIYTVEVPYTTTENYTVQVPYSYTDVDPKLVDRLKGELAAKKKELAAVNGRIGDIDKRINELNAAINGLEGKIKDAQKRVDDAQGNVNAAQKRMDDAAGRIKDADSRINDAKGRIDNADARIKSATELVNTLNKKLEDAKLAGRSPDAEFAGGTVIGTKDGSIIANIKTTPADANGDCVIAEYEEFREEEASGTYSVSNDTRAKLCNYDDFKKIKGGKVKSRTKWGVKDGKAVEEEVEVWKTFTDEDGNEVTMHTIKRSGDKVPQHILNPDGYSLFEKIVKDKEGNVITSAEYKLVGNKFYMNETYKNTPDTWRGDDKKIYDPPLKGIDKYHNYEITIKSDGKLDVEQKAKYVKDGEVLWHSGGSVGNINGYDRPASVGAGKDYEGDPNDVGTQGTLDLGSMPDRMNPPNAVDRTVRITREQVLSAGPGLTDATSGAKPASAMTPGEKALMEAKAKVEAKKQEEAKAVSTMTPGEKALMEAKAKIEAKKKEEAAVSTMTSGEKAGVSKAASSVKTVAGTGAKLEAAYQEKSAQGKVLEAKISASQEGTQQNMTTLKIDKAISGAQGFQRLQSEAAEAPKGIEMEKMREEETKPASSK